MSRINESLGISSIAWEPIQDEAVAEILIEHGITHIDLTPSKYFSWSDPEAVSKAFDLGRKWSKLGFEIRGVQSLLFGAQPCNVLEKKDWPYLIGHFQSVFNVSSALGAKKMVFGSPGNRIRGDKEKDVATTTAIEFFKVLADLIGDRDLQFEIEPNPTNYGCDFINTTTEALELVSEINRSQIKVQLDLGTCFQNEENLDLIDSRLNEVGYVHFATKNLWPLHEFPNPLIHEFLARNTSQISFSIEQKTDHGKTLEQISESLKWLLNQVIEKNND